MSKIFSIFIGWAISSFAHAYIACNNVPVRVETSTTASFHNMHEVGVTGTVLFLAVPPNNCKDSTGTPIASTLFLVIDDYSNGDELARLRASMLLSAEARRKTINVHAGNLGTNSRGFQIIRPYYLSVNP